MNHTLSPDKSTLSPEAVRDTYAALPEDARIALSRFLDFLRQQSAPARKPSKPARRSFQDEPFVGMWKDRPEMQDSVEYIRDLRKRQFREPPYARQNPDTPEQP